MTQAELSGSIHDLSRAVAQLTSARGHCQRGACSHASTHCHSPFPLSALRPDPDRLQINFTTWNAANTNYERKAHLEGRQKSAPFSVSQLSPPPHHVFPKPGAVPSTKCTGKRILGPAVIWSWRAGCGWIRNQPIGPGTMRPLVRLREGPSPSATPPALPQAAFRRAGCQDGFCSMPFPASPVLYYSYFLFWMTHSLCCERLWLGAAAASLEVDTLQATGWYWYLCASSYGAAPAAAPGITVPLESQGLETSREAASHQPHRALHALHRSVPGTRFYLASQFCRCFVGFVCLLH